MKTNRTAPRNARPSTAADCYSRITDAIDLIKSAQTATLSTGGAKVDLPADVLAKLAEARAALDAAAAIMEHNARTLAQIL